MPDARRANDSNGVRDLVREFLDAFENLDLARFLECWDTAATVIHPFSDMARRVDTWEEVQLAWRGVFDFIRATAVGPPYLSLRPLDLAVAMVGDRAAIVSFHLALDPNLGRRTLVLENQGGMWKIVHLHASNVQVGRLSS